jgi:hypothetical protein
MFKYLLLTLYLTVKYKVYIRHLNNFKLYKKIYNKVQIYVLFI